MYYVVRYNIYDPHECNPITVIGPFNAPEGRVIEEYFCDDYHEGERSIVVGPGLQDYTPEEYRDQFDYQFEW